MWGARVAPLMIQGRGPRFDRVRPGTAPPRPGYATAPGAHPGLAHVIPGPLAEIHLGSRDTSPARHNPHELHPREPISHNARQDDIFESKSPEAADDGTCTAESGCNHVDSPGRRTAEATAGVRHEKWRSGRIVPSRTRLHHCENRGIMRKLLNPPGVPATATSTPTVRISCPAFGTITPISPWPR